MWSISIAEASNSNQDIHLYNAFFHLIRGGISRLNIDHKIAKKYFTSLNFVTKVNNDSGTQLADLFGIYGRTELEIRKGKKKIEKLDCLESMIYKLAKKKLLRSEEQFKINSFKILS